MQHRPRQQSEFEEKIIQVNRVSKKTKGGNQMGFSVLVVVGDRKGKVGVALGKGVDVLSSIKKAIRRAKKHLLQVPLDGQTIPFRIELKRGAAHIMLKPAPKGSGVIAGGAIRSVLEVSGIKDVVGKVMGSNNQANNAYATFQALEELNRLVKVKGLQLKSASPKVNPLTQRLNSSPVNNPSKTTSPTKPSTPKKSTSSTAKPHSAVQS